MIYSPLYKGDVEMNSITEIIRKTKQEPIRKVNFCLTDSTLEKARDMANQCHRSVSSLIRTLIDKAYLQNEETD